MSKRIEICVNGVWAGAGRLNGGIIEDCGAVFAGSQDASEKVYTAIEDAISSIDGSDGSTKIDGVRYSWEIMDA